MVFYLLTWDADYGDEGEGHAMVGVFGSKEQADLASNTWRAPKGYTERGSYDVTEVPFDPQSPNERLDV